MHSPENRTSARLTIPAAKGQHRDIQRKSVKDLAGKTAE